MTEGAASAPRRVSAPGWEPDELSTCREQTFPAVQLPKKADNVPSGAAFRTPLLLPFHNPPVPKEILSVKCYKPKKISL